MQPWRLCDTVFAIDGVITLTFKRGGVLGFIDRTPNLFFDNKTSVCVCWAKVITSDSVVQQHLISEVEIKVVI